MFFIFHEFILFIYSFGVLRRFQHCTGYTTTGSWKGRGNQYIQFVRVLYCKLPTNGKQLPAFPLEAVPGIEPRPQRWEVRVLPLCNRAPPPPIIFHERPRPFNATSSEKCQPVNVHCTKIESQHSHNIVTCIRGYNNMYYLSYWVLSVVRCFLLFLKDIGVILITVKGKCPYLFGMRTKCYH